MKRKREDYVYCATCDMFVDLWKYDNIEDAGHEECKWRYASEEELKELIQDCVFDGCFVDTDKHHNLKRVK